MIIANIPSDSNNKRYWLIYDSKRKRERERRGFRMLNHETLQTNSINTFTSYQLHAKSYIYFNFSCV